MMKIVAVVLFAALAAYADAACETCGTTADLDRKMDELDFSGACTTYKSAYDCNNQGGCSANTAQLTKYVADICQAGTSTLNTCGSLISNCVADLQQANAAAASQNKKVVCSDIATFFGCSNKALAACSSQNSTLVINQIRAAVSTLDLEVGCNGDCAAAAGACLSGLSADANAISGTPNATLFKDMCKKLGNATSCIAPLKSNGVCSDSQANIAAADNMIIGLQNQISDICDGNGNPTDCVKGFMQCGNNLKTITQANACGVMANYMTCAERLPCKYSIEDQIKKQEQTVDSALLKDNCPVTGGCKDRLQKCINKTQTDLAGVNKDTDINKFCQLATSIENCFLVVRHDASCNVENFEAGDLEKQFFADFKSKCGNGTACEVSITNCKKDYAGITTSSSISDKCQKVGKAVGCVGAMLQSDICIRVQKSASSDDQALINVYNQDCGNATACETGVNACMNPVKGVIGDPDSAKATDCPIIKNAVSCLDTMRQKPICKLVKTALLDGENKIRASDSSICGGNAGVSIQASMMVVVLTLVATFLR